MHKGALRYVADTIAIESLASDLPIHKEAGLFDSLGFSGIASTITNAVKGLMPDDTSSGGWIKAIGDLLISGSLFKLHPLLGIVYGAARALNVDVIGIGKKILSGIYSAVAGGANVALSDVDHHGKIAIGMYNQGLLKKARRRGEIDISFFGKGNSKIERVFGNLFRIGRRGTLKTLLVAIVIWTLKTALLGAGILGAAGLITSFVKGQTKDKTEQAPVAEMEEAESELESPDTSSSIFQENDLNTSGRGTNEYPNLHNGAPHLKRPQPTGASLWVVPIYGSIEQTLTEWAVDIYPELSGKEYIMYKTPSFMSMVRKFRENYEPGARNMLVPSELTNRKQVVDTFARDVSRNIKTEEGLK